MRGLLVRLIDFLILVRNLLRSRRDTIQRLSEKIEEERRQHERELERLRSDVTLRDLQIKQLTAINRRDLERVEREIAIAVAGRAQATTEAAARPRG